MWIISNFILMQQWGRGGDDLPPTDMVHPWYKHMSIYQKMVKPEKFTHVVYVNIYVQVRCVCIYG